MKCRFRSHNKNKQATSKTNAAILPHRMSTVTWNVRTVRPNKDKLEKKLCNLESLSLN